MSTTQFMPGGTIHLHRHDLPEGLDLGPVVAVDTETMGLRPYRDRLCLVQLSGGDGHAHLVQLVPPSLGGLGYDCPNLKRLLADPVTVKLMHFARFDVAVLQHNLDITVAPVRCTKIAARLPVVRSPRTPRTAGARGCPPPRPPPASPAPSPTATASRTCARSCSAS